MLKEEHRILGVQEFRSSGVQEFRSSGVQDNREPEDLPGDRSDLSWSLGSITAIQNFRWCR
jgi:hypothetical protein